MPPFAFTDQDSPPSTARSAVTSPRAPATSTSPSTTAGLATKAPDEGLLFHAGENGAPDFSSLARPRPSSSPRDGQSLASATGAAPRSDAIARPTVEMRDACLCTNMCGRTPKGETLSMQLRRCSQLSAERRAALMTSDRDDLTRNPAPPAQPGADADEDGACAI